MYGLQTPSSKVRWLWYIKEDNANPSLRSPDNASSQRRLREYLARLQYTNKVFMRNNFESDHSCTVKQKRLRGTWNWNPSGRCLHIVVKMAAKLRWSSADGTDSSAKQHVGVRENMEDITRIKASSSSAATNQLLVPCWFCVRNGCVSRDSFSRVTPAEVNAEKTLHSLILILQPNPGTTGVPPLYSKRQDAGDID
jgi:hypothetical protein